MIVNKTMSSLNFNDLYKDGFSIIPNCLSTYEADKLSMIGSNLCEQHSKIVSEHDNWQGLYNPFYLSEEFLKPIYNPFILAFVEKCLGKEANPILNMEALFNSKKVDVKERDEIINNALLRKNNKMSNCNIHTDQLFNNSFDKSSPLQICFLIALNDFNNLTGGTAFVKGSHLLDKPRPQSINKINLKKEDLNVPELKPGDAVVFWGHTWHMAMPNIKNNQRWGLSIRYTHWAIKTMFNYSNFKIPDKLKATEKDVLESLIGRGCITPEAIDERKFTITKSSAITEDNINKLLSN